MSLRLSTALLLLALGCARSGVPSPRAPIPSPALAHAAPATIAWEELAREPGRLEARLRILRSGEWPLPLQVRVEVPEGVFTISGRTAFEIGPEVREHVEHLQFSTGDGPIRPLVAYLDGVIEGAGLHGEARLPELREPASIPAGPVLRWGGSTLGAVVPETPGATGPVTSEPPATLH
jgi:hypothetical protein